MRKLILASNNQGKIKEFNFMLKGVYEVNYKHTALKYLN
jgi:inosine/xanthosine triphosphate pyrophosphatase family protein